MSKTKSKNKKFNIKAPQNKILLIFVCAFLAAVLIFTCVFMAISFSREKSSVAYYETVAMDKETANYFVTQYKTSYIGNTASATDTKFFWNSTAEDGRTHGERLVEGARNYISQILITNYLFDKYATLTSAEREKITDAVESTITYKVNGSISEFEKDVLKYGFSYDSYETAAVMLYKSKVAINIVCGQDGSKLKDETELIAELLDEYSHVKLLFISTEMTFELDENGNRKIDENGNYILRKLTDSEKAERESLIADTKAYIDATGSEASMNEIMFDELLEKYDVGDADNHDTGYYLHDSELFTSNENENYQGFSQKYPKVMEKIDELGYVTGNDKKFGYADVDGRVCFIYKYAVSVSDLKEESLKACFINFYSNLSLIFFERTVNELVPLVTFKENFSEVDIIGLPYNSYYNPKF